MSLPTVAIAIIAAVIAITYFCNEKKINDVLKIAEKSGASSSVGEEDLILMAKETKLYTTREKTLKKNVLEFRPGFLWI